MKEKISEHEAWKLVQHYKCLIFKIRQTISKPVVFVTVLAFPPPFSLLTVLSSHKVRAQLLCKFEIGHTVLQDDSHLKIWDKDRTLDMESGV